MKKVCLNQMTGASYPDKKTFFRPDTAYPEYIFPSDISGGNNDVYKMIRDSFHMLGMDDSNYGTKNWNPLGEKIKPGDNVLIKPNMVLHFNSSGCGVDCLYTHPSLVAAVIDYALIALKGEGKIIVGDAPLQECDFDVLINESGYADLISFYRSKGICIDLVDFRNVKTTEKDGLHYLQEEKDEGVIVRLNENSEFHSMNKDDLSNLRITNYDPRILRKHHNEKCHEYKVSKYVLNADVIINMPKPKTHRKAGVTISLKNLVGINTNKEFLPHHSLGSSEENGDAYEKKNYYLTKANEILDLRNELVHNQDMEAARMAENLYNCLREKGIKDNKEKYWEGSWHGNNTIWKTIVDLNRILLYADKNGVIQNDIQRKLFIVGDMIISGQKEGPLEPSPLPANLIVMGDEPVFFDRIVCSVMGFDYKLIPSLYFDDSDKRMLPISKDGEYQIVSNKAEWNDSSCEKILADSSLKFQPTMGWVEKLGNKYLDDLVEQCLNEDIYIWGAGANGKYAANYLLSKGIRIRGFLDNNADLTHKCILNERICYKPDEVNGIISVVGGVRECLASEIESESIRRGWTYLGTINQG